MPAKKINAKNKKGNKKIPGKEPVSLTYRQRVEKYHHSSIKKFVFGRPSRFEEIVQMAVEYLNGGFKKADSLIPSIQGLAVYCGCAKSTLYEYGNKDKDFSDMLEYLVNLQANIAITKGLNREFQPVIAKLILAQGGFHDKSDQKVENDGLSPVEFQKQVLAELAAKRKAEPLAEQPLENNDDIDTSRNG